MFDNAGGASAPSATLDAIKALVVEYHELNDTIEAHEEMMAAMKRRFNELKTKDLPKAMEEALLPELTLEDGRAIVMEDFVAGSLPKDEDKKAAAIEYMGKDEDLSQIIKTAITLPFTKTEHNRALDLFNRLVDEGYIAEMGTSVHAQSLLAIVREKLREGDPIDLEVLGIYRGTTAKLKVKKVKTAKKPKVWN